MWIADSFDDYEILDCAGGLKLERWGKYKLIRPEPQAIWQQKGDEKLWDKVNARYFRSKSGGGSWEFYDLPESWQISYKTLTFNLKPFAFKHTGLFPEQAVNWDFITSKIKNAGREISVLNLFAYTGGASLAALKGGSAVCHVDAAKGMVSWAKENTKASGLDDKNIRFIVDDCEKFVGREIRRGKKYDAIILDPPSYGRGPSGEVWKIEDKLYPLLCELRELLSDKPLFLLLNSYTTGLAPGALQYLLSEVFQKPLGGQVISSEIGLKVSSTGGILPCGASARWELG